MTTQQEEPLDPLMGSAKWRRRLASIEAAAVAGLVCAIGWSFSLRGLLGAPNMDASAAEVSAYFRGPGPQPSALFLLQVLAVATLAFLWFVGVIRARIGDLEPKLFGTVFFGGAILLAALVFVGAAALASPAILIDVGETLPDPGAVSLTRSFAAIMLSVFAPRVAALVMFSTAGLGRATGVLPRWLVVATYVVGVGELVNTTIRTPNIYVFPAWIALVSVVLLVRRANHGFDIAAIQHAT